MQRRAALPPDTTERLDLTSVPNIVSFLSDSLNDLRTGKLDPKIGNAISCMAGTLLRAIEGSEMEQRMRALEERLEREEADKKERQR